MKQIKFHKVIFKTDLLQQLKYTQFLIIVILSKAFTKSSIAQMLKETKDKDRIL